jgi:hypothetical protein
MLEGEEYYIGGRGEEHSGIGEMDILPVIQEWTERGTE